MGAADVHACPEGPEDTRLERVVGSGDVAPGAAPVEVLCETVCARVQELLRADGACVSSYLPETDETVPVACTGLLRPLSGQRCPVEGDLRAVPLHRSRSFIDNDVPSSGTDATLCGLPHTVTRLLGVPLVSLDTTVGTLSLVRTEGRPPFTDADSRLLQEYAIPVALALDSAERLEKARASVEAQAQLRRDAEAFVSDLRRLHHAEISIASDLDVETVLERVVKTAAELTGAGRAALGLVSPTQRGFDRFVYSDDGAMRSRRDGGSEQDDLIDRIISEGRPLCTPSTFGGGCDQYEPGPGSSRGFLVGMPVTLKGDLLGVLYLSDKPGHCVFTERDEAIVQMLAGQAAVMIDKARVLGERQAAIRELETQRAVRSRLSAYVNHDIRNALHGVALWAERLSYLAPAGDVAKVVELAARIEQGTTYALRLVRDVLDLTALDEGRLVTWPRSFSVAQLLETAVEAVAPDAERADMGVFLDCPRDVTLVADPDRIRQIITNLLSNAVKFAPDGSAVRVVARNRPLGPDGASGRWVSIDVQDEGPGIAEEHLAKIFGAYERGMAGQRKHGRGLGLTISRHLARHMGGRLFVRTAPGKGATFTLWVPGDREPSSVPVGSAEPGLGDALR